MHKPQTKYTEISEKLPDCSLDDRCSVLTSLSVRCDGTLALATDLLAARNKACSHSITSISLVGIDAFNASAASKSLISLLASWLLLFFFALRTFPLESFFGGL